MAESAVYLEKLSLFARMLRLEGLSVGPQETADASQVLITLGLEDRETVKTALRTVFAKSREELSQRIADRYREMVIPKIKAGLCGCIYTQVSDVEDEINGLLTYDRKVEKLKPEIMLPVAKALYEAMEL